MSAVESPYLLYLDDKFRFPRSLVHRPIQRFLQSHLNAALPGTRVLDAGCGNGIETGPYAGRLRVVGLDYQREYAATCARRYPEAAYAIANLAQLPVADDCFDLIVMNQVIEHVADPSGVIGELTRALAAGGRLLVATPNYGGKTWPMVEATWHRWFSGEFKVEENHVVRFNRATLRALLSASLMVERVETVCANLILVAVARKPRSNTSA